MKINILKERNESKAPLLINLSDLVGNFCDIYM